MQTIDMKLLSAREKYHLITGLVVPRPVAWVSTINALGQGNLAPFSYFNLVAHEPAIVMISIGQKMGMPKDTLRNVMEVPELVIHIADRAHAEILTATAMNLPYGENEADVLGLPMIDSQLVKPKRLSSVPVAMEARVHEIIPVKSTESTMVLAELLLVHYKPEVFNELGRIQHDLYKPIARLDGSYYAERGEVFSHPRPQ